VNLLRLGLAVKNSHLLRFLGVGILGTLTNLAIFYVLVDLLGWGATRTSLLAFCIAASQNYVLNHHFSFSDKRHPRATWRAFLQYVLVNLVGLGANLCVMNVLLLAFAVNPKVIAQFFGIGVGTVLNYLGARHWVFQKKNEGSVSE